MPSDIERLRKLFYGVFPEYRERGWEKLPGDADVTERRAFADYQSREAHKSPAGFLLLKLAPPEENHE